MKKKVWEKSPEELIEQFYSIMELFPEAELRKMFGYPCAFLNGNMFCGLHENNMILRLSLQDREKALENQLGNIFAPMAGRILKEYIALSEAVLSDKKELNSIFKKSFNYVKSLPLKIKK